MGIYSLKIQNFKSIRDSGDIRLKSMNVLIGPNGAGKSNFISFFKLLNKLVQQQLQLYINQNGRAGNILYFGLKKSSFLSGSITFDNDWQNQYDFKLIPDTESNLIFQQEGSSVIDPKASIKARNFTYLNTFGHYESVLKNAPKFRNEYLRTHLASLRVFHFHDTSFTSKIKQPSNSTDYAFLQDDGGNLAAFLFRLQEAHHAHFNMIEKVVRSIAPFFDRFFLERDEINPHQIYLRWLEKGSDQLFNAHNLSDGTLRMICLTTLLLQPTLPSTIIIDEPELGLHPFAISKLADMLIMASDKTQIIISTQSVSLVNEFTPDDVIVVERKDNQTVFNRQSEAGLEEWLKDYSLGELWEKNVLGGRPK